MEKGQEVYDQNVTGSVKNGQPETDPCPYVPGGAESLALRQVPTIKGRVPEIITPICWTFPNFQDHQPCRCTAEITQFHEDSPHVPRFSGQALRGAPTRK
ncbi:hypothetical protein AMECASPLE_028553 [Ameca splendens]|uniref:Uncharacterized protein n=1 Tax=Ameca splendens TaxID=208324 RepID=A0ABV0YSL6_9TELE